MASTETPKRSNTDRQFIRLVCIYAACIVAIAAVAVTFGLLSK